MLLIALTEDRSTLWDASACGGQGLWRLVDVKGGLQGGGFSVGTGPKLFNAVFAVGNGERLGSFCNLRFRGERLNVLHEDSGKSERESGVGLQRFKFAERAMEVALDARVMAGEAIELGGEAGVIENVEVGFSRRGEFRFHAADAAEVPGGRDELVEQDLLERALRPDVGLKGGEEFVKFFAILGGDDDVFGRKSVLAGVL